MIVKPADTKTRILDAAQKLFAQNGFDGTSLRDITSEAEANLAAVNYHFQTKESLIEAVIARLVEPVNEKRLALLEAAGPSPTLEQILNAFISPILDHEPTGEGRALMGRILGTPDQVLVRAFRSSMRVIAERFIAAIAVAVPEVPADERMWRLHFTAGAMAHTLSWSHLWNQLDGMTQPADRASVTARLVAFAAAGFRGVEGNGNA
jgi:AcrR family transcriptional regulator